MATYGANDGLYGTGTFGTAIFGQLTPVIALTGVFGTGVIEPPEIGGFEVDIGVRLTATTVGTGSVGSIPTSQVHVGAGLTGVTATVSLGQISISSTQSLFTVVGTGSVGSVGAGVTPNITGVTATGSIGSVQASGDGTASLAGVSGTIVLDIAGASVNAVVFNFEAVRDQYSRRRSITIPRAA
tara:strand:+ start:41 stop:592 length:552 start_codon:yes stop_codon:yes gene_type:complete